MHHFGRAFFFFPLGIPVGGRWFDFWWCRVVPLLLAMASKCGRGWWGCGATLRGVRSTSRYIRARERLIHTRSSSATRLEVSGQELGGARARADIAAEFVADDGVRVPVCIEVFKGHTMQGATRFGLGLRARRHFPIVFAVVLLADTVRSVQKRQTLEGHINLSLDLEISQRNRAFYGASMFVYI